MIRLRAVSSAGILLALLILAHTSRGQDSLAPPPVKGYTRADGWTGRKIASTAVVGAVFVSTWVDAYYTWWKQTEKPFSFFSERWFSEAHGGIDKPGHFFGTYSIFRVVNDVLLWGGYDRSTAFWWATGLSLFNGFQIEVGDGFSQYGFDYQDLVFDFAGVGYGMLQSEIPLLENFDFKFSYWSKTGINTPIAFTKDYDAMTIWLSFGMHNLLPEGVARYWPEWLNLAVGYSVDDRESKKEVAIGIDLNFEGFSTHSENVYVAERLFDLWHAPLPAVKFTERKVPRWYGAYRQ
jgi:hypothetical protein